MKLDPELLRACASYLKHAETYCLDGDDQMALLRETAHPVVVARRCREAARAGSPKSTREITADISANACDEMTHAHLDAIRQYARRMLIGLPTRPEQDRVSVSSAILDATPSMLAWWCERLDRK